MPPGKRNDRRTKIEGYPQQHPDNKHEFQRPECPTNHGLLPVVSSPSACRWGRVPYHESHPGQLTLGLPGTPDGHRWPCGSRGGAKGTKDQDNERSLCIAERQRVKLGHYRQPMYVETGAVGLDPLVGMALLDGHNLNIDVENGGRVLIQAKA